MPQTDQQYPSRQQPDQGTVLVNADGSVDVFFGPKAPAGKETNWVQTDPGQGLEHDPAPLRSARALVRQDVAARRDRTPAVTLPTPFIGGSAERAAR